MEVSQERECSPAQVRCLSDFTFRDSLTAGWPPGELLEYVLSVSLRHRKRVHVYHRSIWLQQVQRF
jgi:hypothetical protein